MQAIYHTLIPALWLLWLAVWIVSAMRTKRVVRAETLASRLSHLIPLGLGIALLMSPRFAGSWLATRLYSQTVWTFWCGTALVVLGLGFAVWARVHLAGNWSGTVTLKHDHSLTRSGP
jgi:protein-S-isoprenylcysteine O-methyltransferase Ste14